VIVGFIWVLAFYVPGLVAKAFDRDPYAGIKKKGSTNVVAQVDAPRSVHTETNTYAQPIVIFTNLPATNVITVDASHRLKGYWEVILSDGTVWHEGDPGLETIARDHVQINGKKLRYTTPEVGERIKPLAAAEAIPQNYLQPGPLTEQSHKITVVTP